MVPVFEWAAGKELAFSSIDFKDRIQKLLVEIHKRCLADQVLLLTWNTRKKACKVLGISPIGYKSTIHPQLQLSLIQKVYEKKRTLYWEDLWEDGFIREKLKESHFETLFITPLNLNKNLIDVLIIVNYSAGGGASQVIDFISFISSVLALAIQNSRLYSELKRKNMELKSWTAHVEERIEEGTKKLLEKEMQYRRLFEGANDGILVHDVSGSIVEVNRIVCRILGYDKKDLLKLGLDRLVVPDYRREQAAFFKRVSQGRRSPNFETMLRKNDGSTFHAELSSQKVRFQGREVIQTFVRDVSIKKALEVSLRESKDKYRILVESSLVGVFIIRNGVIQFVNTTFEEMTGYEKNELLEKNFFQLISADDREAVIERETRREEGDDQPDHYEVRFLKKNGEAFWGELRSGRVVIDGKASILGNVIDVTQRRQLEMQVLEVQKMESIGTLAGGIAHDFNNLLGGILGYATLLLSDMSEDHPHFGDINAIAETTKRAADLTNRLLAFARGGKYQVAPIELNQIVGDVAQVISSKAEPSVDVETPMESELWPVLGDARQIQQAILNICLNAVEAMPSGGRLTIKTSNVTLDESFPQNHLGVIFGDYVCISITDTGVGMDQKIKTRIFEPFFTTKPTGEGSGFGLAMVYGVVKNHDGAIHVESTPNRGTEVQVFLPRFIERPEKAVKPRVPKPKEGYTVLLVDDEEVIRQVARRMLEKGGFEVMLANDGQEAVRTYEENKGDIDIVLLDLIMPKMGGRETFRRLKEIDPKVNVVFTSGYRPQDRPEIGHLTDAPFIQKPFQTEILIQTMKDVLGVKHDSR
jgi:PAS domain S-box-containing protein